MRVAGRDFAPAAWATLATLAGVALTIALGYWQLGRADTKQALQNRISDLARQAPIVIAINDVKLEDVELRPIEARGRYEPRYVVFIDNRLYKHQPGYYVMMPLRLAGSDKVLLINRGWVSAGAERNQSPQVKTPEGARP